MKSTRIVWADIAKYICIMCVMNSHVESATTLIRTFYEPFFLTVFFFCSGYTYRPVQKFRTFFAKKVQQLFVPWLIYSNLNIFLSQILSFNEHKPLGEELLLNFMQIRGHGDGVWFVAALFVAFIPFYYFIHWYEKRLSEVAYRWLLIISLVLSVGSNIYVLVIDSALLPWNSTALPWHMEYIFIAMFYMVLGYLFRTKFEANFERYNSTVFRVILCVLYLSAIFVGAKLIHNSWLTVFWTYVEQLLGIATIVSICKVLPANKMILYIGQNTLLCFALHGKVYSLLQVLLRRFFSVTYGAILENTIVSSLFSVLFTIALSIILIVPIWFINRWLPFTIGRRKKLKDNSVSIVQ